MDASPVPDRNDSCANCELVLVWNELALILNEDVPLALAELRRAHESDLVPVGVRAQHPGPQKSIDERMAEALGDFEPSEKELHEIGRELDERERRIARFEIAEASHDYAIAAHRWLAEHHRCEGHADTAVQQAIETIDWDSFLIHVKIKRALNGRDEYPNGAPFEKSAIQSDWNGSAKVALLSVERSEPAWRIVAAALTDEAAGALADSLADIRRGMNKEFPRAVDFRRPGFDG